jgi:hypothetical protein
MTRTSRREVEALLVAAGHRAVPESKRLGVLAIGPASAVADHAVPSRRELRAMLRAAGARPVPALTPEFVAFAEPHGAVPRPAVELEPRRRSRRPALVMGAAAATLSLVLVGALTEIVGGPAAEAQIQLVTAIDTVVVLPGGSTVDGTRGLALPNGAVVRTGPLGRASAGGVDLGPGDEAVVENGRLVQTATTEAAPTVPATPSTGVGDAANAAVDETAAAVEDVPMSPPAGGGGPTEAAPVSEVPAPAPTLPTLTVPTLPEPRVEPPSLPGVGPLR